MQASHASSKYEQGDGWSQVHLSSRMERISTGTIKRVRTYEIERKKGVKRQTERETEQEKTIG